MALIVSQWYAVITVIEKDYSLRLYLEISFFLENERGIPNINC
jgi:hypothetical protein